MRIASRHRRSLAAALVGSFLSAPASAFEVRAVQTVSYDVYVGLGTPSEDDLRAAGPPGVLLAARYLTRAMDHSPDGRPVRIVIEPEPEGPKVTRTCDGTLGARVLLGDAIGLQMEGVDLRQMPTDELVGRLDWVVAARVEDCRVVPRTNHYFAIIEPPGSPFVPEPPPDALSDELLEVARSALLAVLDPGSDIAWEEAFRTVHSSYGLAARTASQGAEDGCDETLPLLVVSEGSAPGDVRALHEVVDAGCLRATPAAYTDLDGDGRPEIVLDVPDEEGFTVQVRSLTGTGFVVEHSGLTSWRSMADGVRPIEAPAGRGSGATFPSATGSRADRAGCASCRAGSTPIAEGALATSLAWLALARGPRGPRRRERDPSSLRGPRPGAGPGTRPRSRPPRAHELL